MQTIGFIYNYARSGGTLLNKYLVRDSNLVVLSEAHPVNTYMRKPELAMIEDQVKEWYGITVKSKDYIEQICEIANWCENNDKFLIIRDWSFIDFTPYEQNYYHPPLYSQNYELLKDKFNIKQIAFVRNAMDVFLSREIRLDEFSYDYLQYVEFIQKYNIKVLKYEDFCKNTNQILNLVYTEFELNFVNLQKINENNISKVVGDINFSRGNKQLKTILMRRKYANYIQRLKINKNSNLKIANRLLGYTNLEYNDQDTENIIDYIKYRLHRKKRNFLKGFINEK